MLVDVFETPQRFRLNTVGNEIRDYYGADIVGKFVDEIEAKGPLAYFMAQASATVEAAEPTYYHDGFARLFLPMWGGGYVSMLLGTFVRPQYVMSANIVERLRNHHDDARRQACQFLRNAAEQ